MSGSPSESRSSIGSRNIVCNEEEIFASLASWRDKEENRINAISRKAAKDAKEKKNDKRAEALCVIRLMMALA
jgi:hypothetical protein